MYCLVDKVGSVYIGYCVSRLVEVSPDGWDGTHTGCSSLDNFKIFGAISDDSEYMANIRYARLDDGRLPRIEVNGQKPIDHECQERPSHHKQGYDAHGQSRRSNDGGSLHLQIYMC